MHPTLAIHTAASLVVLGIAAGCTTDPAGPATPPNPPPPPETVARWSDPTSWPGGTVPVAGADVVIPEGRSLLLDVSPPTVGGLTIDGALEFDRRDLDLSSEWIQVRGTLRIGSEGQPYTQRATITLTGVKDEDVNGMGDKVLGVAGGTLELHGAQRTAWTRLSTTAGAGATEIMVEAPTDWRAGDRLVVASTDFDPFQAEEVQVASVQGQLVRLQGPLEHTHWGQLQTFAGRTLDERAEVALLTRNIVIQGDEASLATGFGGHIIVMQGGVAHVEGIELTRMGQRRELARYPMHWHLEGSVPGQYFRNNAVWKTFNRCLTIHGTSDLVASDNVCYDNSGHAFFLEDGAETGNQLHGNLGLVTRRPATADQLLPSDRTPATFWITHPANSLRDNVAGGSQGFGFWYALPVSPTGPSIGSAERPRQTPLGEFEDNVAHSNRNTGLNVDHGPRPDGTTETAHYAPRLVPGDNQSPLVTAHFRGFTGYKHSGRAVWLRGSELRLDGAMLADNHIGATFASNETFLEDAVLIGSSANSATPFANGFPVRGYEFYDGRVGAERVTFVNYVPTARNYMSALGFNRSNGFPVSTGNRAEQLSFVNANAVFLEDPGADKDGDKAAVILDADGSLTGTAGQFVVTNSPLLTTAACVRRDPWNAFVCPTRFVNLRIRGASGEVVAPLSLVRDDGATGAFVGVPNQPSLVSATVVGGRRYDAAFAGATPARPQLYARGLVATDFVRVSFPYPTAAIEVVRDYNSSHPMSAVASLAALDGGTGGWFYDAGAGVLHFKLMAQSGRDWATLFVVPK